MTRKELIEYWFLSAEKDYKTVGHLYDSGDYHWALFISHLVVEKLLKSLYVKRVDSHVPYIHDLVRLAEKTKLEFSENQKDFLDLVTTFNIRTRYPDYKYEFYKRCTKEFTAEQLKKINGFRKWIKKTIKEDL